MLWLILRERITNKPYYLVTDESVIMNGGSQEHLYASNMTMKPKELCDLLNERVKKKKAESKRLKA